MNATIIHGVQVDALRDVETTLRAQPSQGAVTFRVNDVWGPPALHRTTTGDISGPMVNHHRETPHVVEGDEPQPLLGSDQAISPVELLLTAITHCVGTTLSYHAALRNVELRDVAIDAEGAIDLRGFLGTDSETPARLADVRLRFTVDSDASRPQIEALIQTALERSPVTNTVTHGTRVAASLAT